MHFKSQVFLNRLLDSHLVEMTPFQSENFFKLRASQYSNDWTGQQGGKYGQRFIQNGLRDFINEYVDASIPAYIKTRWTTSSYDQIKTKSGKLMYFCNILLCLRRSAPSGWSSSLYRPMRISDQMTIGKTHPTLCYSRYYLRTQMRFGLTKTGFVLNSGVVVMNFSMSIVTNLFISNGFTKYFTCHKSLKLRILLL